MNNHRLRRRPVPVCLTLLWMAFIFLMSSAEDDVSNMQSSAVCEVICETFVEGYEDMQPEEQAAVQQRLSFPVRKAAHLTEYTILGILLWFTTENRALALLIGSFYSVTDEIHQIFVPGRAGQLRDVLIDTAGVLLGILLAGACRAAVRKHRK